METKRAPLRGKLDRLLGKEKQELPLARGQVEEKGHRFTKLAWSAGQAPLPVAARAGEPVTELYYVRP